MDEITIPYHLAIPTIICLVGLLTIIVNHKKLFSNNKILWISITTFLILYLFIVGTSTFDSIYYQWDLNRYDLNNDGMFGGAEITDAQNEAMRKLTSDTGRNVSFISGFIFAIIISTVVYILGRIILKLKHNERKNYS